MSSAESFTKKSPYAFQGKDLVFGPYTDVPAGSGCVAAYYVLCVWRLWHRTASTKEVMEAHHLPKTRAPPHRSLSPLMIHYQNNAPFAKAATAIREIEVSHWGNVAFEEFMEVQHAGARLKGGFSRYDFMHQKNPASFQGLVALLPHGARNIYYRDQIGNISNSEASEQQQRVGMAIGRLRQYL